jgi:hypothetical protein
MKKTVRAQYTRHGQAGCTAVMGLLHATGRPYQSFVYLLEELSRPSAGNDRAKASSPSHAAPG